MINGLDVYKFTTSLGIDLELMLMYLDKRSCVVDWLTYVKSATVEGWLISTVLRKLQYPITEVWGERYWKEVEKRIKVWFVEYMNETYPNAT